MLVKESINQLTKYLSCVISSGWSSCYTKFDALTVGWALVVFIAAYCFIASIIGKNCSKVDQLWSITPVVFAWHFLYHHYLTNNHKVHQRVFIICLLITVWGIRLTYNFWRKGGYGNLITHEEDYRWPILRAKMSPALFLLFNFSFIACYQNVLLYWIAVPVYQVSQQSSKMTAKDLILVALFMLLFGIETVADEQHFQFQSRKHCLSAEQRASHADRDIRRGFYTRGLFRSSRHPNYFAEQAMWVVIYLFTCCDPAHGSYFNWTGMGAAQLILLFQGSMNFSESITSSKYPEYKLYQQSTSQCIPWWPLEDDEEHNNGRRKDD